MKLPVSDVLYTESLREVMFILVLEEWKYLDGDDGEYSVSKEETKADTRQPWHWKEAVLKIGSVSKEYLKN